MRAKCFNTKVENYFSNVLSTGSPTAHADKAKDAGSKAIAVKSEQTTKINPFNKTPATEKTRQHENREKNVNTSTEKNRKGRYSLVKLLKQCGILKWR